MPSLARIDEVVDAVVAKITASWGIVQEPDGIQAADEIDIVTDPTDPEVINGRQVYVLPDAYDNPEQSSRGSDFNDYTVVVLIAERYSDPFTPPELKEWVRGLRYWVEQTIYKPLTDLRANPRLLSSSPSGGLIPVNPSGVETPFDTEELRERKLFFSVVRVTFREDVDAS